MYMYIYIYTQYARDIRVYIHAVGIDTRMYTQIVRGIFYVRERQPLTAHDIRRRIAHLQDGPLRRRSRSTRVSLSHEKLHLTHT